MIGGIKMNDYLLHSSKGTSWKKKQAEYDKKINKRYYYSYESLQKKLWKLKKKNDPRVAQLQAELDTKRKAKGNARVAKIYNDVADKTGDARIRKEAEYYQRRANDAIPKKTKATPLKNIASDTINRGKMLVMRFLKGKK